jgi:hypothetical protein
MRVLASVERCLAEAPAVQQSIFVTRDAGDFLQPDVTALLGQYTCQLFTRFNDVLRVLERDQPPS